MADPRLKTRRRLRFIAGTIVALICAASAADRAGVFHYRGDDRACFDQQSIRVMEVIDGDTVRVVGDHLVGSATVRLLGVDAPDLPDGHWSDEARRYTSARAADRYLILRLDGTQTRDEQGNLLAYLYVTDGDCLNADIIRDGQAYADRRIKHSFRSTFEQAERDARTRRRGLWKNLRDDQMPAWRQTWLRKRLNPSKSE